MTLLFCFALGGALVLTGVGLWEVLPRGRQPHWQHYMARRKMREVLTSVAKNAGRLFVAAFVGVFVLSAAVVGVFEVMG